MEEIIFKCSDCGSAFKENETHCSICNSIRKTVTLNIVDIITIKEQISGKAKDYSKPSKKRVTVEFISGSEQSKNGCWIKKERVIDRTQNIYLEKVVDENGNVIHICSEKLTDHVNHGTAKFPRKD